MRGYEDITVACDPYYTLAEWMDFVKEQMAQYGEDAIMYTDGGHNNVTMVIRAKKP